MENIETILNEWELLSQDEETILAEIGSYLFDVVARVQLSSDNSMTDVFFPERLAVYIDKLKANPTLPDWVYERFKEAASKEVLDDNFVKFIQNELRFTPIPIENFTSPEEGVKRWVLFDTVADREKRFLGNFASGFGIQEYLVKNTSGDVTINYKDLKQMYLQFVMMECMSNKMMEAQESISENRSGVGLLGD
jgi:hypothetical protein